MSGECQSHFLDKIECITWISVRDRMPEKGKCVLCLSNHIIFHAWWDDVSSSCDWYNITNFYIIDEVTHWMALPKSPEE